VATGRLRSDKSGEDNHEGPGIDCSIIVVHYRAEADLAECLARIAPAADALTFETIVIDNSATLRALGFLERYPQVIFSESPRNLGFAQACNEGIRRARGRHVLLLNPDAFLHEGAIATLVRHLDAHPADGLAAPRLHDPDGALQHSCRRFPGLLTIFFGRYALMTALFPRNRFSGRYLYLEWDHADTRQVDWASGACLMASRAAIERVGALDPGYFLFVEDMDWCRRMRDAGYGVAYVADALVTHRVGISRAASSVSVIWARHRSMLRYVRRHLRAAWPLWPLIGLALGTRAAILILRQTVRGGRGTVAR
jgi:N-acetylglucosaminyl-diphospho-decaprenol L-rhamnosyltransferase